MPYALYLPRETEFTVTALGEGVDIACGWCRSEGNHPPRLVTPEQVAVEIRGGGNATRQINSLFPPGFDCHRLVAVEVYTPAGSWSSYPPHKHDVHRVDAAGNLLEADLGGNLLLQIRSARKATPSNGFTPPIGGSMK